MSVNRYECGLTNAPTEYQSPTMYQDENGGYVFYEDYANLEGKCAALAAENAGLKRNLEGTAEFCYSELPETTATDAFLAEVRAISMEDFADVLAGSGHYDAANHATKHAHKIRKEAK